MARALHAASFLATAVAALCMVLLLLGISIAARPELLSAFGLHATWREGLALALGAGVTGILCLLLGRVLSLLQGDAVNQ